MTTFPNKMNACERISRTKLNLKYDFKALLTASILDLILLLSSRMGFLFEASKLDSSSETFSFRLCTSLFNLYR